MVAFPLSFAPSFAPTFNVGTLEGENPPAVPQENLVGWYDFDEASTVTLSGSNITAIAPRTGSLTLSAAGANPTLVTDVISGRKMGYSAGADDIGLVNTSGTPFNTSSNYSIYIVLRGDDTVTDPTTTSTLNAALALDSVDSADSYYGLRQTRADLNAFQTQCVGNAATLTSSPKQTLVTTIYDGTNVETWDGGNTTDGPELASVGTTLISGVYLFNDGGGNSSRGFIGWIGEVLIYDTAHDADTRAEIESYLTSKWNVGDIEV